MKAERRHELQSNELALWLMDIPGFFRKHLSKILLALVFLLLAVVLIRNYLRAPEKAAARAAENLALVRELSATASPLAYSPSNVANLNKSVEAVLKDAKDPNVRAQALLLRGDFYRKLAEFPSPDSTSRPFQRPEESVEELLLTAEQSYQEAAKLPADGVNMANAHFGLAAVEENRAGLLLQAQLMAKQIKPENPHIDSARAHYQAILDDTRTPKAMHVYAQLRLERLPDLAQPLLILPATKPAATAPTTVPATAPTTVEATAPATRP